MTGSDKPLICLPETALDRLMPMSLRLDANGRILFAGATVRKLWPGVLSPEATFFDFFSVSRPAGVEAAVDLSALGHSTLYLKCADATSAGMKAVIVPSGEGELFLNLSFGISIVEAIANCELSASDFAATDLTIELLYLAEANGAAMREWRALSGRLQGARDEAEEQAFTDALTGLRNRRALDIALSRLEAGDEPFAILQIDLDLFKEVNDTLGHAAGDFVLMRVAEILRTHSRPRDELIRLGGDEFVVLLRSMSRAEAIEPIASRIIEAIEVPATFEGEECRVSASIGGAFSGDFLDETAEQMIKEADEALYASKNAGRACFTLARQQAAENSDPSSAKIIKQNVM